MKYMSIEAIPFRKWKTFKNQKEKKRNYTWTVIPWNKNLKVKIFFTSLQKRKFEDSPEVGEYWNLKDSLPDTMGGGEMTMEEAMTLQMNLLQSLINLHSLYKEKRDLQVW